MKNNENKPSYESLEKKIKALEAYALNSKKNEATLQESKEKYETLLNEIEDEYYEIDLNGSIEFCNSALFKNSGYSSDELLGMNYKEFTSEKDVNKIFQVFNSVFKTGNPANLVEYEVIKKDGSSRIIEMSVSLLKDPSSKPIGFRGIARDITEKKKYEKRIIESEKKYRNILEIMDQGYFEMDLDGKYTYVNDAELKIHNQSREELIGHRLNVKLSEAEEKKVIETFTKIYETGKPMKIVNWEHYARKDTPIYVESSIALMKNEDNEPIGFCGISRDVTERIINERDLKESERKYRNILETMEEGYFELDLTGKFIFVNEAECKLHRRSYDEMIGYDFSKDNSDEYQKRAYEFYNRVYRTGESARVVDWPLKRKDGSTIYVEISASLIRNEKGKPVGFRGVSREVTERKRAVDALKQSEQKYRNILENMEEGYLEIDLAGNYTFVNEALCRAHGFTKEELIGMNNREYSSPEEAKKIYAIYHQVYKTGLPASIVDYEIIHKDGSIKYMETSISLIKNGQNEPIGFSGITRDVTQRRKAEKALKKSEEKYRTILETMEEGYYEVDLRGTFTFANPAEFRLHGLGLDGLIGLNNREFSSPETSERVYKIFNEVYRTGVPSKVIDYEITKKDGSCVILETSASLIHNEDGKPIGFRGISRDITARKKAEDALRDSEEKYRLLIENANDGIFIYQDNVIQFPNFRTEEITGYTSEELKKLSFVNIVHADDRDIYIEQQERTGGDNKHPRISSFRLKNKNNEILWMEMSRIAISWEGKPAELIFLRDISDQKKIEVQLLQAQKMEALGTLAGGIAHDFNNLLMGIQGNASLVQLALGENNPQVEKLKSIEKLVTDGAELTKQLLGVARGGKYEVMPTNINRIIDKSSDLFGRTRKEISVHKILKKDLWVVDVDKSQIEQVLLNIYVNAWHAMPDGGDLYLETKNTSLDEYYTKSYGIEPGRYIRISVTDNGVGMDEETRKRVFDPFFTTKEMGRGTGLGLASAYGIIRNHKGIINVYSEIQQGTTFNIYLPVSGREVTEEIKYEQEIIKGTETILFVDDESTIIEVGHQLLEILGYKVMMAKSGKETIDIYKKEGKNIDLVILDMVMPTMSGGEAYDELVKLNPEVKVLLSSGYSINGQAEKILDRGCKGFIQKPFNLEELSKRIREVLDN